MLFVQTFCASDVPSMQALELRSSYLPWLSSMLPADHNAAYVYLLQGYTGLTKG